MPLTNIQQRALISLQKGLRKVLLHGSGAAVFQRKRTGNFDKLGRPVEIKGSKDQVTGKVVNILRTKGLLSGINQQAKSHNQAIIKSFESSQGLKDYYKSKRQIYRNLKSLTRVLKPELIKAATKIAVVRSKRHNSLRRAARLK